MAGLRGNGGPAATGQRAGLAPGLGVIDEAGASTQARDKTASMAVRQQTATMPVIMKTTHRLTVPPGAPAPPSVESQMLPVPATLSNPNQMAGLKICARSAFAMTPKPAGTWPSSDVVATGAAQSPTGPATKVTRPVANNRPMRSASPARRFRLPPMNVRRPPDSCSEMRTQSSFGKETAQRREATKVGPVPQGANQTWGSPRPFSVPLRRRVIPTGRSRTSITRRGRRPSRSLVTALYPIRRFLQRCHIRSGHVLRR